MAFQVPLSSLSLPQPHRSSCLVSHTFLPMIQHSAFRLFPFVLPRFAPTAVSQVLAFRFPSGVSPLLPLSFVRFHFRLRLLSFSALPFPSSLFPRAAVHQVKIYPLHRCLFPCMRFRFGTQHSCNSLTRSTVFASQVLPQLPAFCLSASGHPLSYTLGLVFGHSDTP